MSDVDMIQRINRLEDRADEQDFEIEKLQRELVEQREAMITMFKASGCDIKQLAKFNS